MGTYSENIAAMSNWYCVLDVSVSETELVRGGVGELQTKKSRLLLYSNE